MKREDPLDWFLGLILPKGIQRRYALVSICSLQEWP